MSSVFHRKDFKFPYTDLKFPGQASDERILYVTREAPIMLQLRLLGVVVVSVIVGSIGFVIPQVLPNLQSQQQALVMLAGLLLGFIFFGIGWWWTNQLWQKSLFVLTTRRLTKYIYTTPWNRYNLSLNLDKIVDTGSYERGYFQALAGVGTFTARSSAGNRAEKYFYIENVHRSEDLKNYVSKLLHNYNHRFDDLDTFRPFLPWLKGEARKRFMESYPEYWS